MNAVIAIGKVENDKVTMNPPFALTNLSSPPDI